MYTRRCQVLLSKVRQWREAGLTALNVSVDSLDPQRFHAITGHDRFDEVMADLRALNPLFIVFAPAAASHPPIRVASLPIDSP